MSEYRYYIKKIFQPAPNQVIIEAGDKVGRPVFKYQPGQYAMISYRNRRGQLEDKHAFSLASSPANSQSIIFGIKIEGAFTRGLLDLQVGDELRVFGPYGNFCYQANKYPDAVMIAGGIGITPFFSALNYAHDLKLSNKLALIYSARTRLGATFYPEIRNLQANNPNLKTLFSFTEESGAVEANIINTRIGAEQIKNFIGDINGKTFFICGPSLFMAAIVANLLKLGVPRAQIKMEEFSMIPDKSWSARLKNISYALAFSVLVGAIIFFSFIYEPKSKASKNNYDANQLAAINSATYERMITIYDRKNKALADLNQQILAATNKAATNATSAGNPVGTPAAAPVYRPATVYTPAPVYTPPKTSPVPTTGVSRAR
ncbi:MAG: FAD-dependent oxidoreductase [Candidatus Falkowbacteria bacterium]|nr:MAG: FAD-dependent oxidoreductase [Candidatus Falkowbacteria bacterium]